MKLLITGASGFVGAETARIGLDRGHDVLAIIRPGSDAKRLSPFADKLRQIEIDLEDREQLRALLQAERPNAIIHSAWSGVMNTDRFDRRQIDQNLMMSCNLVEDAASAGVQAFIGIGSQAEYGPNSAMLETSLPQPTTLYGAAKLATFYLTKQIAEQAHMRHVWLRLFSTYGPGDNDGWLIPTLIHDMLEGRRPKTTEGLQRWDYLFIRDVAEAIIAVAETQSAKGLFNLGSGKCHRVRDIVTMIRDLIAPDLDLVFGEIPYRDDQVMQMQADITRLTSATSWTPRISIEDGLALTIDAYRQMQNLKY